MVWEELAEVEEMACAVADPRARRSPATRAWPAINLLVWSGRAGNFLC